MNDEIELWKSVICGLLTIVDAVERYKTKPEHRTAELREIGKKVVDRAKQVDRMKE